MEILGVSLKGEILVIPEIPGDNSTKEAKTSGRNEFPKTYGMRSLAWDNDDHTITELIPHIRKQRYFSRLNGTTTIKTDISLLISIFLSFF